MTNTEIAALVRLADDAVDEDDTFRYECAVTLAVGVRALVAESQRLRDALLWKESDDLTDEELTTFESWFLGSPAQWTQRLIVEVRRFRAAARALGVADGEEV